MVSAAEDAGAGALGEGRPVLGEEAVRVDAGPLPGVVRGEGLEAAAEGRDAGAGEREGAREEAVEEAREEEMLGEGEGLDGRGVAAEEVREGPRGAGGELGPPEGDVRFARAERSREPRERVGLEEAQGPGVRGAPLDDAPAAELVGREAPVPGREGRLGSGDERVCIKIIDKRGCALVRSRASRSLAVRTGA